MSIGHVCLYAQFIVYYSGESTNLNMAHNDEVLVVLEEVARVNKELINENRVLREDLERRDQEQRKILADLNQKLEEATSGKT